MKRRLLYIAILLTTALPVAGANLVSEFSGTGFATTAEFEVEAPWIMDWRVNSDYPKSMAVEVQLLDGATGFQKGQVLYTKFPGNGVRMFRESGRFRLRISATLSRWNFKIEELTPAEAELYTPRRP